MTNSVDMNLSKLWEIVKDREAWRAAVHGVTKIPLSHQGSPGQVYLDPIAPATSCP